VWWRRGLCGRWRAAVRVPSRIELGFWGWFVTNRLEEVGGGYIGDNEVVQRDGGGTATATVGGGVARVEEDAESCGGGRLSGMHSHVDSPNRR
jgi:hypothetical protein